MYRINLKGQEMENKNASILAPFGVETLPPPVAPKGPFADYSAEEIEAYAREYVAQYVERIRHLEREHGLLSMVVESLKTRCASADALIEDMATKADRRALRPAQSIGDDETFIALARHWAAVREMYEDDEHKSVVAAWAGLIAYIDGRTAGTASDAAPADLADTARTVIACLEAQSSPPHAPGHRHEVPGIWDKSNEPAIAGKPCSWCATWNRFKSLAAAPSTQEGAND